MSTLRLILGDQLNPCHSWFTEQDDKVIYTLMECREEASYVLHHGQKILGIFAAMRDFAQRLIKEGHRVHYLTIDDATNLHHLKDNLLQLAKLYQCQRIEYQEPDEFRVDRLLSQLHEEFAGSVSAVSAEHFYTDRLDGLHFFNKKQWLMERFYRHMRKVHGVLIDEAGQPTEGQWNFDEQNREPWRGDVPLDKPTLIVHDHQALWQSIQDAGIKSMGFVDAEHYIWPLNREEALIYLERFIEERLRHFGRFQDAMVADQPFMFHSLLSFALNTKMLTPREVVERAVVAYQQGDAPIAAVEGFIRQILGWREYVRCFYWAHGEHYQDSNYFNHQRELPEWFWTGKTHMRCLSQAIGQSLEQAYAHHIHRLMIIGNAALLMGLSPQAVSQWYLGVYIDAFEWVEQPNTLGMSQFADGGLLATKPYVSSAAYVNRMSNYCKGCTYQFKLREEENACPLNALYWHFHYIHRDQLMKNHRLSMVYRQWQRFDEAQQQAILQRAQTLLTNLQTC